MRRGIVSVVVLLAGAWSAQAQETQTIWKLVKETKLVPVQVQRWVEEEVSVQRLEHSYCQAREVLVWDSMLGGYISTIRHEPVYTWVTVKEKRQVLRWVTEWREQVMYHRVPETVPIPEIHTTWPHPLR